MKLNQLFPLVLAAVALGVFVIGCNDAATENGETAKSAEHDDHDHDHDHDHGDDHSHDHPAHGPNGGHIVDLDGGDVAAEWCKYKDNDVIRFYLLNEATDKAEAMPMKVESFVVKPMAGKGDTEFTLEAENAGDDGMASSFMLEDKDLSIAIPLGVKIEIKTADKTLTGKIEAHKPLDH